MISTTAPKLKAFLQMPAAERRAYFDNTARRSNLRKSRDASPYEFKWICTGGERGVFTVVISEAKDFSERGPALVLSQGPVKNANAAAPSNKTAHQAARQAAYQAGIVNFLIGKTYYWKVVCKSADGREVVSDTATFRTDPLAPRLMDIPKVGNVRDIGGRTGLDGKALRQGMIFRSASLNHDSPDFNWDPKKWKKPRIEDFRIGAGKLTPASVAYIDDVLGWKTELDLRSHGEVASMSESPAGPKVKWIEYDSASYGRIYGKKWNCLGFGPIAMAEDFRIFCDRGNYPIVFHCSAGADRTEALAFVLDATLGVDRDELEKDWEVTANSYFKNAWFADLPNGLDHFGKTQDPLYKKAENYLHKIGITDAEIARFRAIMLQ